MTLLGPMLPILSARWSLDDARAGYLFAAQFVTSMLGALLSGVLVERHGYRLTLAYGLILMAIGIAALAQASWALGLISVCVFGAGFGFTTPAANLLIAKASPRSSAAALNLLNSAWGIGAMSSPLLVAATQRSGHTSHFLYGLAAALLALALGLGWVRFAVDAKPASAEQGPKAAISVWNNRLVPVIAALFFIYVGTETCMGGWIASYARRLDSGSHAFWAVTPSFFWGALLLGPVRLRWFCGTCAKRASPPPA
jgi:FHS family glucose/mannose:H+ symporter-like MFS transporter